MSGVECLKEIKKVDPNAIVIICSSETNPELLAETMSLGALTVINKPPTRESIQQVLTKAQKLIK
jgi:DNA-binding NtrC family response regulator